MKRSKYKIIISVMLIVILVGWHVESYAHVPSTYHFRSSVITYYYVSGSASYNNAVTTSISYWNNNSVAHFSSSSSGAQISI